ncbi:MAG TPA: TetR/AcrR family transcriptional regulator [Acidimicrobiia bacterium]|nr:TetR/AcrR family transcriptional regulator [Acidimicrobiia bacterium]
MAFSEETGRPQQLVAAARALANETGSAAFTVAQLAGRAGLSLKAFYSCFRSKDDLLLALLAEDSRIGADALAARIGAKTGPDALRAYVSELFDMVTLPGAIGYAGVLVREHRRLTEFHDDELRDALAPLVDLLAAQIESDDAKRDARTMFAVLLDGIHDIVVGRVADAPELARYLERFCTEGIGYR